MKDIFHRNKKHRILELLLFLLAFSIPISLAFNSIMIAVLLLFSFSFFNRKTFIRSLNRKEVYLIYFMFFLIQVVSLVYVQQLNLALETVQQNLVFLVLPIIFINLKGHLPNKSYKAAYLGLYAAIMLNVIISLLSLLYQTITSELQLSDYFREKFVQEGFYDIHVPYEAMLLVFLVVCTFDFSFTEKKQRNTFIKSMSIVIFTISLFFLSGMMSIVILILIFYTRFLLGMLKKSTKIAIVLLSVLGFGFSINYIKNYDKLDYVRGSENIAYRIQKMASSRDTVRQSNWKSVAKVIVAHPILGVGADGGLNLLQKERSIVSESYINKHKDRKSVGVGERV